VIPPSSKDLAPGASFGSYLVHELIGRGGMARVYRAQHVLLNKPVALKVMDHALLLSAGARQRFLQEGRAAAAIEHPNVVDVTDVGVHEGVPYLVMELLEGEDLEAHLRKHTVLDDAATIRLALPVIAALQVAHSSGIVHRDIKPSNIFMSVGPDDQFVPKVLDFGISKVSFDNPAYELMTTPQHQIIGTPRYMPPEALHGARELGPLSDQYSLGVVLYQCVTGCTPFAGDTLVSLLNSLSRGSFEPPRLIQPNVSVGLDRIITRSLSPDPSDRFPTIKDMGRALLELAAERTQMVWGRSFRAPSTPQPILLTKRSDDSIEPAPPSPLPTTKRISPWLLPGSARRWRLAAVGLALLFAGALAPALWTSLSSNYFASGRAASIPVRQAATEVPPSAPMHEPKVEEKSDTTTVPGLAARPSDEPHDSSSHDAIRRVVRSLRAPSRHAFARSVRSAEQRTREKPEAMPPEAPSEAMPPEAPSTEAASPASARSTPPSDPPPKRVGANRSPLLD
jgi:serine/threonine protein kinase